MSLHVTTDKNIMVVKSDRVASGLIVSMPAGLFILGVILILLRGRESFMLPLGIVISIISLALFRHVCGFINDLEINRSTRTLRIRRVIPFLRKRWKSYGIDDIRNITYQPETPLSMVFFFRMSWGFFPPCISINLKDGKSVPVLELGMPSTSPWLDARLRHREMAQFMQVHYRVHGGHGESDQGYSPQDEQG